MKRMAHPSRRARERATQDEGPCDLFDFDFSIAVVNGTSIPPRLSSDLLQAPIRSIEIGSADAIPTAVPRSFARLSSWASARSISTDVGTASMLKSALANGIA